ncbi:MAG: hypothetical protein TR69_WS6001000998 [candidate division WS6 bacterium OLB20]|uniref:Uncharacterized protein n=1 Tax=candidate division WS6 bacterium OLB20 TaxID=1617426 RepID=A0A136LZA1_9BACT|nr:MAG: hypothetical protein TR69_WS6001000998 [candidate division WS6 bacterium OLB20]
MRKTLQVIALVLAGIFAVAAPAAATGGWDFLPEWGGYYSEGALSIGSSDEPDGLLGLTAKSGSYTTLSFAEAGKHGSWEISKVNDASTYYPPNSLRILNTSRSDGTANSSPALVIDQYNRVGLGRRDPQYKLDLNYHGDRQARFLANTQSNALLLIENQNGAGGSVTGYANTATGAAYYSGLAADQSFKIGSDKELTNDPFMSIMPNGYVALGEHIAQSQLHVFGTKGDDVRMILQEKDGTGDWRILKTTDDGFDHRGANRLVFAATSTGGSFLDNAMVLGSGGNVGFGVNHMPSVLTVNERNGSALTIKDQTAQFQADISSGQLQIKSMNSDYNVKDILMKIGHNGEVCIGSGC